MQPVSGEDISRPLQKSFTTKRNMKKVTNKQTRNRKESTKANLAFEYLYLNNTCTRVDVCGRGEMQKIRNQYAKKRWRKGRNKLHLLFQKNADIQLCRPQQALSLQHIWGPSPHLWFSNCIFKNGTRLFFYVGEPETKGAPHIRLLKNLAWPSIWSGNTHLHENNIHLALHDI